VNRAALIAALLLAFSVRAEDSFSDFKIQFVKSFPGAK
jgi:hypothetical protein